MFFKTSKLKVDGFRQGHVPASIAKARINPVEVLQDAMFTLVNKEYANVLNEEKFYITVYDEEIEDSKIELKDIEKKDLKIKLNKKTKLFI